METKIVTIDDMECEIKQLTFEDMGYIQSAGTKIEFIGRNPAPKIDVYQLQLTTIMKGLVKLNGKDPTLSQIRNMNARTATKIYEEIDKYNQESPSESSSDTEGVSNENNGEPSSE